MHSIHPTAIVSKECELGEGVEIGPFCIVNGKVRLGAGVKLVASVHITGPVTLGEGCQVFPGTCLGFPPQDFKYKLGDPTAGVVIGKNSTLRENVTVHAATKADKPTRVGDNVLMMCNAHVGHDAAVDNRAIMVNNSALAGHSHLGEGATLSASVGIHQFCRVGRMAFVSANVAITGDILPFCMCAHRRYLAGLNLVGLRRSGMPAAHITGLREAFREAFRTFRTQEDTNRILEERSRDCPPVGEWLEFVKTKRRTIVPGFDRAAVEDETVST